MYKRLMIVLLLFQLVWVIYWKRQDNVTTAGIAGRGHRDPGMLGSLDFSAQCTCDQVLYGDSNELYSVLSMQGKEERIRSDRNRN